MTGHLFGAENAPKHFCLDVGGTGTRGALFAANGEELARADGPGGALSLGAEQSASAINQVWCKICDRLGLAVERSESVRLWAGIAGVNLPGRKEELDLLLKDFSHTHFVGDGYGALLAATGGKPGALISVGTGVIAQRLLASNQTLALSGWGFPAGDLGGGAWIGLQLVGALTKYVDGVNLIPPLPRTLALNTFAITGNASHHIQHWLATAKPRQYGSLTPFVAEEARAGDPYCQLLLNRAAQEIVCLAQALYEQNECDDKVPDIHLTGGLGGILSPYCSELTSEFNWVSEPIDPVSGIHLLATGDAPDEILLPRRNIVSQQ